MKLHKFEETISHIQSKFFIISTFVILIIASSCINDSIDKKVEEPLIDVLEEEKIINLKYGIESDPYRIVQEKIKQNETIGDIFSDHNIDYAIVLKASEMDSVFDIRRIKKGNSISYFFSKNDSVDKPDYIVYEKNIDTYIVFDLRDSLHMYVGKKEKQIHTRLISGKVESSLWNAMTDIDVNPILAVELSEVYAWSIDFFGLQAGDHFSVVYEESYIDSNFNKIEKINAIRFDHSEHHYYAYRFEQDSIWSFFDEKGNSLRKAFLKAPLRFSRISSRFSNSRMHPVLKIRRPHHGVDYAAPKGTPVFSVGDGKVVKKGWDKGGGRFVRIKHNSVYSTVYMHFSKFASGIKVGDFIQQGQVIGYVGSSGLATGPHLDFRFYKNGSAVNPLKVESPPVEPIKEVNKAKYKLVLEKYQGTLDSLISTVHIAK